MGWWRGFGVEAPRPPTVLPSSSLHLAEGGILGVTPLAGDRLLTQGRDGWLRVWAAGPDGTLSPTPTLQVQTESHGFCVAAVATGAAAVAWGGSPSAGVAVAARADAAALGAWSLADGALLATLDPPAGTKARGMACGAAFVGGGIAAAHEDGSVVLWAPPTAAGASPTLSSAVRMHADAAMALVTLPGGAAVASAGADATLALARVGAGGRLSPGPARALPSPGVACLAAHEGDDGNALLAAACWDGSVRLAACAGASGGAPTLSLTAVADLPYHERAAAAVAFAPDGLLASAGRDGAVALWRV